MSLNQDGRAVSQVILAPARAALISVIEQAGANKYTIFDGDFEWDIHVEADFSLRFDDCAERRYSGEFEKSLEGLSFFDLSQMAESAAMKMALVIQNSFQTPTTLK